MTHREADGSDKIVAYERGMSDDRVAVAFETPGVQAYIVNESYLVAYSIERSVLIERVRMRLYDNAGTLADVTGFLAQEAATFDCTHVIGI